MSEIRRSHHLLFEWNIILKISKKAEDDVKIIKNFSSNDVRDRRQISFRVSSKLTNFYYPPWIYQKTSGYLIIPREIEVN